MNTNDMKTKLNMLYLDRDYMANIEKEIEFLYKDVNELLSKINSADENLKHLFSEKINIIKSNIREKQLVIRNLTDNQNKLLSQLNCLGQPQRSILYMRYFKGITYEDISYSLNYSLPRIYQLHKQGLNELARNNLSQNEKSF